MDFKRINENIIKCDCRLSDFNYKVNIEGFEEEEKEEHDQSSSRTGNASMPNGDIEMGQTDANANASDDEEKDIYADGYRNRKFRDVPMIYACATMWHETKNEMIQLMKSIFRMDRDQNLRRHAELLTGKEDKDFYEFEGKRPVFLF